MSRPPLRSDSPPSRPSSLGKQLALSGASLVFALLAAELCMRVRVQLANSETLQASLARVVEPSSDPGAGLANLIRLSANDALIYELQPNLVERSFSHSLVSTNERGFRVSPPVPLDARPLFTIVGLGDSLQFGHGVADEEPFLYRLQELLQEQHPERRWNVVNSGVPGYNTVMEVETLRTKCLELEPDLVILNIVGNDYAPPFYVRQEQSPWKLDRSYLLEALREGAARGLEERAGELLAYGLQWYERDSQDNPLVPEEYRHVFGPEAFAAALDELRALSLEHDFEVLCFTTYEWDKVPAMVASARRRDFPYSSLMPELIEYLAERGLEFNARNYRSSELVVNKHNAHPSALQHDMAARRLLTDLERFGLLELDRVERGSDR